MSNIASAIIGLVGGLLAALLVAKHQALNTKTIIAAELDKLFKQKKLERESAIRSRNEQWLLEAAHELLVASDPQLHAQFDYSKVVSLIHRIQIILNPNNPLEAEINQVTSDIGFAIQEAITERRSVSKILSFQNKLVVTVRAYLDAP